VPPDAVPALDAAEGVEAEGPAACRHDAELSVCGSSCTCSKAAAARPEAAARVWRKPPERVWKRRNVSGSGQSVSGRRCVCPEAAGREMEQPPQSV
jgi:hypothetical protein